MSAPAIKCLSGHSNAATQKFCGECGLSLAGACLNGHQNPDGQRFCGECGSSLDRSGSATPAPNASAAVIPAPPSEAAGIAGAFTDVQPPSRERPEAYELNVGDKILMSEGTDGVVVRLDGNSVWLDLSEYDPRRADRRSIGVEKLSRMAVADGLSRDWRLNPATALPASLDDPRPEPQTDDSTSGGTGPEGWYDDPDDSGAELYWDGNRWRGSRRKEPSQDAAQSPQTTPGWYEDDPNEPTSERYLDVSDSPTIRRPLGGLDPAGTSEGADETEWGSHAPLPSAPAGSSGGIQAWWARLQTEGKAAVVGVAALLIVILMVTVATGGGSGRDKESYTWGYQTGTSGFTQDWAKGTSDGVKKTCQDMVDYWIDLMKKKDIDRGDAVEGCMDAVNGRPLGPG